MKFSIIVPIYKVEKYLAECVDSILSQSFTEYELILIDDGSPDNCPMICDELALKDKRIKVIHKENGGLSDARNAGTNMAQGEYVIYLDSDDYISDNTFLSQIAEKTKNDTQVILYGYKKYFESNDSFGSDVCCYPDLFGKTPSDVIELLLKANMYDGSSWNKAVRRDLLVENNIRFVPKMISEDSDWFLQVVTRAKTYDNINKSFVVYRQHEGSISHDLTIKSLTDNLKILENWPRRFEELQLSKQLKELLMSVLARYYANLLVLYSRYEEKNVKEYYLQVKKLKYLLRYSRTKRAKVLRLAIVLVGVKRTIWMLRRLNKIKRKA